MWWIITALLNMGGSPAAAPVSTIVDYADPRQGTVIEG